MIKLRGRLIVLCRPGLAAIDGNADAAIVRVADAVRISRINPKPVMISMSRGEQREIFSAIHRTKQSRVHQIHRVSRFWIGVNFAEIPGALPKTSILVNARPMLPGIIRAIEPTFLRLDDCVNAIGIGARNGDADLAKNSIRQSVSFQMFPGHPVIFRMVKSTPRSAAREKPRLPARLPKGREDNVRIVRIENNVDAAGVLILTQYFGPRLSAISRSKNSTLRIRPKRMTESGDQNNVGISWIDNQRTDLPRIFQTDVFPRFPGIDRFVNTDPAGGISANCPFARARVHDVVVRRRYGNCADG